MYQFLFITVGMNNITNKGFIRSLRASSQAVFIHLSEIDNLRNEQLNELNEFFAMFILVFSCNLLILFITS